MSSSIKALVVDDELLCRQNLKNMLLEYCPRVEVVGTAASAALARPLIEQLRPDVVFLDVNMPNETGFDLLRTYGDNRDFRVVFTTAYNHFAIKAIKADALDYLLKPIDIEELEACYGKLLKFFEEREAQNALVANEATEETAEAVTKISLPHANGFTVLETKNIMLITADNVYATLKISGFSAPNNQMLVSISLKEFEEMLPEPQFVRIHKSHIVNLDFVKEYISKDNHAYLQLTDNSTCKIARRKVAHLNDCLTRFGRILN